MSEVLVSPDAEALVITGVRQVLSARTDAAVVSTRVPNPRPDRLVRVRRRGGARRALVLDQPMLVLECWDASEPDAAALAGLVAGAVLSMEGSIIDGHMVYAARVLGGPNNDPDPDTDTPRYTLTVMLSTRATAV